MINSVWFQGRPPGGQTRVAGFTVWDGFKRTNADFGESPIPVSNDAVVGLRLTEEGWRLVVEEPLRQN